MSAKVERGAPVQGDHRPGGNNVPGTIAWAEHLQAFEAYAKKYGRSQSAERIAERGGFDYAELAEYLGRYPDTWEPR